MDRVVVAVLLVETASNQDKHIDILDKADAEPILLSP
jgi:hypothetical protein